jgi:guanylate kinase
MRDAATEISHYDEFDFILVNDDFDNALLQLKSIIIAARMQKKRQLVALQSLLTELSR